MFGSLGITELILILVIVLIVFGAGKLPKIGEGMGKALKGFKKEIREADALEPSPEQAQATDAQVVPSATPVAPQGASGPTPPPATASMSPQASSVAGPPPVPPQMGPAATPGTTAYMVAQQAWKPVTPPPAAPPPPTTGSPTAAPGAATQEPAFKAVVNKDAVNRVMKQQAAMKTKDAQAAEAAGISDPALVPNAASSQPKPAAAKGPSAQDFQSIGAGLGDAMRTFREAANDVRRAVDPEMQTIKAEMEAAQKEIQSSIDQVKHGPKLDEPPPKSS
jgi:TatA/E family protein of Tat protein translocase